MGSIEQTHRNKKTFLIDKIVNLAVICTFADPRFSPTKGKHTCTSVACICFKDKLVIRYIYRVLKLLSRQSSIVQTPPGTLESAGTVFLSLLSIVVI